MSSFNVSGLRSPWTVVSVDPEWTVVSVDCGPSGPRSQTLSGPRVDRGLCGLWSQCTPVADSQWTPSGPWSQWGLCLQEKMDLLRTLGADVRPVPVVPFSDPNNFNHQVTADHPRSPPITPDHPRSPPITHDHPRSPTITHDHPRSPTITHDHPRPPTITQFGPFPTPKPPNNPLPHHPPTANTLLPTNLLRFCTLRPPHPFTNHPTITNCHHPSPNNSHPSPAAATPLTSPLPPPPPHPTTPH